MASRASEIGKGLGGTEGRTEVVVLSPGARETEFVDSWVLGRLGLLVYIIMSGEQKLWCWKDGFWRHELFENIDSENLESWNPGTWEGGTDGLGFCHKEPRARSSFTGSYKGGGWVLDSWFLERWRVSLNSCVLGKWSLGGEVLFRWGAYWETGILSPVGVKEGTQCLSHKK